MSNLDTRHSTKISKCKGSIQTKYGKRLDSLTIYKLKKFSPNLKVTWLVDNKKVWTITEDIILPINIIDESNISLKDLELKIEENHDNGLLSDLRYSELIVSLSILSEFSKTDLHAESY